MQRVIINNMNKYVNLNILTDSTPMKYVVELCDNHDINNYGVVEDLYYHKYTDNNDMHILFYDCDNSVMSYKNYWSNINSNNDIADIYEDDNHHLTDTFKYSTINIYFPEYSIDTYVRNTRYVCTLSLHIGNTSIVLLSKIINRNNSIACKDGYRLFMNERYYDYLSFNIIDPYEVLYGEQWESFRYNIFSEYAESRGIPVEDVIDEGSRSNLIVTLHPVIEGAGSERVKYIELPHYNSSQSIINIYKDSDRVKLDISTNVLDKEYVEDFKPSVSIDLKYLNCNKDGYSFKDYIRDYYNRDIDDVDINLEFFVMRDDEFDIYKYIELDLKEYWYNNGVDTDWCRKLPTYTVDDICFDNWGGFKIGMKFVATLIVVDKNTNEDIIKVISNNIPITQDIIRFFIKDSNNIPVYKINLDEINMDLCEVNIVNKTIENVIQVDRPKEYKSNIIKPIFFKVQSVDSITVHTQVTENICIDLSGYKNKVDMFSLKIGGVVFQEIGRNINGVLFKVVGSKLDISGGSEGYYYILDDSGELVVSGKYIAV